MGIKSGLLGGGAPETGLPVQAEKNLYGVIGYFRKISEFLFCCNDVGRPFTMHQITESGGGEEEEESNWMGLRTIAKVHFCFRTSPRTMCNFFPFFSLPLCENWEFGRCSISGSI